MQTRNAWLLVAILWVATNAPGAEPAPGAKEAFMNSPAAYISFEITQAGSLDFTSQGDGLTGRAYRINKSLKFEVPLDATLPESCPMSTTLNDAMEEGRCMGWTFNIPDDPGAMDDLASGKMDLSSNPLFTPARYSVDDVLQSRYRDTPQDGWATQTTTLKGSGVTYLGKSGMLLCDFKSLVCDLSGFSFGTQLGDPVTITTTSDAPGFEPHTGTQEPNLLVPQVPEGITNQMLGFPLSLPGPTTLTFSGPGESEGGTARPAVVVKMMVSSKPVTKSGAM